MATGARFLNDNGSLMGLNVYDLIGAVGVLIVSSEVLRPLFLEFLSIPIAVAALIALIPIRLRYRRKIIRDSIGFAIGARVLKEARHAPKR
ncbi:MAG: hypothetical protein AABZ06_12885 [Bdellovibrionota bacterium]